MAESSTINVLVTGKDELSGILANTQSALNDFSGAANNAKSKMADFTSAMKGPMLTAGGLTVGAFTAIGVSAFDMALDMDNAQRNLQTQLGVTTDVAQEMRPELEEVFTFGLVDSAEEASTAVAEARRQLQHLADDELGEATNQTLALSAAFNQDYAKTLNSINALQSQFGLSFTEAIDFVTTGFQQGLDSSGDFLDSVGEYSNQFAEADFSASEFFSVMQTGLGSGVLGTDKISDAFKEFRIIMMEGSDDAKEALQGLGLDAEAIMEGIASGNLSTADAFTLVQDALIGVDDQVAQNNLGVALFGTMWEDAGASAILGIDATASHLDGMAGATEDLLGTTQSMEQQWTATQRELQLALMPLGEELLKVAQEYMPEMREAASWLAEVVSGELPGAIDWTIARFGDFRRGVGLVVDIFEDASRGANYLKDQIVGLWDKITNLDDMLPDWLSGGISFIGDLFAPGGGVSPGGGGGGGWDGGGGGGNSVSVGEINVNGAQDPQATAQAVREELIRVGRMNAGNSDLFGGYA